MLTGAQKSAWFMTSKAVTPLPSSADHDVLSLKTAWFRLLEAASHGYVNARTKSDLRTTVQTENREPMARAISGESHKIIQLNSGHEYKSETHVNAGVRRHLQVLRLLGNTDQYRSSGKEGVMLRSTHTSE